MKKRAVLKLCTSVASSAMTIGLGLGIGYVVYQYAFVETVMPFKLPADGTVAKNFSILNSYRVSMANKKNSNMHVSGTAWSFDWKDNDNDKTNGFDWYLMTNYHVVQDVVESNSNAKVNSSHTVTKPSDFRLEFYTGAGKNYKSLFSESKRDSDVEIWTDYNNTLISSGNDLFSGDRYNLDMALIKIKINENDLQHQKDLFSKDGVNFSLNDDPNSHVSFPYKNWEFKKDRTIKKPIINQDIYIAGNPGDPGKLVGAILEKEKTKWDSSASNFLTSSKNLKYRFIQPNFKTTTSFNDPQTDAPGKWILGHGSSGSAVYMHNYFNKFEAQSTNLNNANTSQLMQELVKSVPVGIFWGGFNSSDKLFSPAFTPLEWNGGSSHNQPTYSIFQNWYNLMYSTKSKN